MSISEFIVREQAGHWQVWQGGLLVGDWPSQFEALCGAEAMAHAAAARGQRARLLVGDLEFSVIEPRPRAAPEQGAEKVSPKPGAPKRVV